VRSAPVVDQQVVRVAWRLFELGLLANLVEEGVTRAGDPIRGAKKVRDLRPCAVPPTQPGAQLEHDLVLPSHPGVYVGDPGTALEVALDGAQILKLGRKLLGTGGQLAALLGGRVGRGANRAHAARQQK
jgi:hypothetical protein